ncbi:DUF6597 domain-containing transcriptional factor [Celerinatantimonas yamalensis]|uniref:DUF6597 domain-containing transcriptional factor n=1 Tax=Celerinatantimonas yamalensis TaxID=559956 RepID=A0ABW9G5X8_9GAMM
MDFSSPYQPFQPTLTCVGQDRFGLNLQIQKPSPSLSETIYAFVEVKTDHPTMYPIVPDGTNILFFSVCSELFGGTQSSILDVPLNEERRPYFGIWFQPGKVRSFFDVDVSEVTNKLINLDFLENSAFLSLQENLYEKSSFKERVAYSEALLLKHVAPRSLPAQLKYALLLIYRESGMTSMTQLASEVGLSTRHMNRQFLLYTGLTSKAFAQTIRMNQYLKRCYQDVGSYLHHGLDLGFFDQSHLLKTIAQHGIYSLSAISQQFMSNFYKPRG